MSKHNINGDNRTRRYFNHLLCVEAVEKFERALLNILKDVTLKVQAEIQDLGDSREGKEQEKRENEKENM